MSVLLDIVEGWTGALPFTLKADGVAVDLSGLTVSIILKDGRLATVLDSTSRVAVTSSTGGIVSFTPTSSEFVAKKSPYRVRFQVASTADKVFFPNGDEDLIAVKAR